MEVYTELLPMLTAAVSLVAALVVWWWRERRLAVLRQRVAAIHTLSEEVLARRSAVAMQELLGQELAGVLNGAAARLWLGNRAEGVLEPADARSAGVVLQGGGALARCFEEGAARRAESGAGMTLLLPMRSEGETLGVMELGWSEKRRIPVDEQAALAHLANQAAIALRLLDQSVLREQVVRSERLGAVGQLMSGVAAEMQEPIEEIARIAARLQEAGPENAEYRALGSWSAAATEALDRLNAFGQPGETRARPLDLRELLRKLVHFRERTWRLRSVETRLALPEQPLPVMGSYGQLEQALLAVLLRAEELLPAAGDRRLSIGTQESGDRAQAIIEFPTEGEPAEWGLSVAQGIAGNHGGTLRLSHDAGGARCVLDLPRLMTAAPAASQQAPRERPLTLLLVTAEAAERRHLIEMLSARGHRVIPAAGAEEALMLAGRLRFDAILAAAVAGDESWRELHERSEKHTGCFVLLPASEDPRVHPLAASGAVLLLRRPPEPAELARVLLDVEARNATAGA